jgi:hypothetical protein
MTRVTPPAELGRSVPTGQQYLTPAALTGTAVLAGSGSVDPSTAGTRAPAGGCTDGRPGGRPDVQRSSQVLAELGRSPIRPGPGRRPAQTAAPVRLGPGASPAGVRAFARSACGACPVGLRDSQTQHQPPAYPCAHCFHPPHSPRRRNCGLSSMCLSSRHHSRYRHRRSCQAAVTDRNGNQARIHGICGLLVISGPKFPHGHYSACLTRDPGPVTRASSDRQLYRRMMPNGPRQDG